MASHYPRPECGHDESIANSEHIIYDCIFAKSILHFISTAVRQDRINLKFDEFLYAYPYQDAKKFTLESFILYKQIKITAFQVVKFKNI